MLGLRTEFILLSDTLGVSALVDGLNNAKPNNATESTVLGPFFTADAPDGEHKKRGCEVLADDLETRFGPQPCQSRTAKV